MQVETPKPGDATGVPVEPKVTTLPYMGEPKPGDKAYIPPHPTIPLTHAQLNDMKEGWK